MRSAIRTAIVAEAMTWVGTPFVHQHRVRGVGVDCAGLVIGVARGLGLVPPDFDVTGYGMTPDGRSLRAYCDTHLQPQGANVCAGDVVLVAWKDGPPHHLGIVVDHPSGLLGMIHAENRAHRKVIETRLQFGRAMRLVAAYRFPGVD